MSAPRFVVDAMLGRLAHWLRAMGYDTVFLGPVDDRRLLELAAAEARIVVTRDAALARLAGDRGCFIRSERVEAQLDEIVGALDLAPPAGAWLSRCLECNTVLELRDRDAVAEAVPPRVLATQRDFWFCPRCARIYWGGSHAEQMLHRIATVLAQRPAASRRQPEAGERPERTPARHREQ